MLDLETLFVGFYVLGLVSGCETSGTIERMINWQLGRFVGFQQACFFHGGQTCGGYAGVHPFYDTRLRKNQSRS